MIEKISFISLYLYKFLSRPKSKINSAEGKVYTLSTARPFISLVITVTYTTSALPAQQTGEAKKNHFFHFRLKFMEIKSYLQYKIVEFLTPELIFSEISVLFFLTKHAGKLAHFSN